MAMFKGFYKASNLTRQVIYKDRQELNKMLVLEALESIEKYQRSKGGELGKVTASKSEIIRVISNRQINGESLTEQQVKTALRKLKSDGSIVEVNKQPKKSSTYFLSTFLEQNNQEECCNINALNGVSNQDRDFTKKQPSEEPSCNQEECCNINTLNGVSNQEVTKQVTNYNKNNNKNNNIVQKAGDLDADISEIWKAYPLKENKKTAVQKIKKLLKEYSKQEILEAIEKYKKYIEDKRKGGFNQRYKSGSTFFNSGIYDYLGEEAESISDNKKTGVKELTPEEKRKFLDSI